jgi:hypothetical protein
METTTPARWARGDTSAYLAFVKDALAAHLVKLDAELVGEPKLSDPLCAATYFHNDQRGSRALLADLRNANY